MSAILFTKRNPFISDANTINEHVASFIKFSEYSFVEWNLFFGEPSTQLISDSELLVFHYSIFGDDKYSFTRRFLTDVHRSTAPKVAFFQDEYLNMPKRHQFIDDAGVEGIYTLLRDEYHNIYYDYTNVKFVKQTLTGFVDLEEYKHYEKFRLSFSERSVDVSYRARDLPFYLGAGGQEKTFIASEFERRVHGLNFTIDISVDEKDRLYGDDWPRLLGNSRFTLGVEAGTTILDITGRLKSRVEQYLDLRPNSDFNEVSEAVIRNLEGNVAYRTISPRFFESAALGAVPIMFPGHYDGILEASKNFIKLEKNFSNWENVVSQMSNNDVCMRIIRNNNALISQSNLSYESFVNQFDTDIQQAFGVTQDMNTSSTSSIERNLTIRKYILML